MGRQKQQPVKIIKPKNNCKTCKRDKSIDQFYNSKSSMFDGKVPICKECLKKTVNYDDMDTIYAILQQMDIMFDIAYWEKAKESHKDTFARYVTMANSLPQFEGRSWRDSIFDDGTNKEKPHNSVERSNVNESQPNNTGCTLDELKEKYGYGYPDDEYFLFERKYQQLRPSFQLVTTMHEEYFREFCVNKVKETLAKAKGNFKEAKEWAAMVKDVAEAGKLKPSQMSKSDLSGGLDTFGQLARMVEENYEIMPILPMFTETPKDKVDVVLWCFINYVRDLKGLPECEYKEIYEFYERRRQEYEKQMSDNDLRKNDDLEEVDEDE